MTTLAPVDLLFAAGEDQPILRTLAQQPNVTLSRLAELTGVDSAVLESQLQRLLAAGRVVERLREGKRTFAVRFARRRSQVRNMPASMLEMFAPPSAETFLAEQPLTRDLSADALQKLLARSTQRSLEADEIAIWQGKLVNWVGVVQSGLLRRTRLRGQKVETESADYLRRGAWVGLSESFSQYPSRATFTAMGDCELLVWSVDALLAFAEEEPAFAVALNRWLSRSWQACQRSSQQANAHVWGIVGSRSAVGTSTIAANLAQFARHLSAASKPRILLWNATERGKSLMSALGTRLRPVSSYRVDGERVQQCRGVDVVVDVKRGDYPLQVQIDMLLGHYRNEYDLIICDLGTGDSDLAQKLMDSADTLITVIPPDDATEGRERSNQLTQKQFLLCNCTETEPPFVNMALPQAADTLKTARKARRTAVECAPDSSFAQSIQELSRRLSLNHTLGIFIPSTFDVDVTADNSEQVDAALAFFGRTFGGATRTNAEGVWRSDSSDLVTEEVTLVRTFVTKAALDRHLDDVIQFAVDLKHTMRQEAVAVDVDSQLVLV